MTKFKIVFQDGYEQIIRGENFTCACIRAAYFRLVESERPLTHAESIIDEKRCKRLIWPHAEG